MGNENSNFQIKKYSSGLKNQKISRNNFKFKYIIGRGGFGKIWKAYCKLNNKYYAIKEMNKLRIIDKKYIHSILTEKEILSKISHPFIITLYYTFQDYNSLYLVMELFEGGDLRVHLNYVKTFSEKMIKFFLINSIISLEYIHNLNIIHRDIKPDNYLLDLNGYIYLTDFGISIYVNNIKNNNNNYETNNLGTLGYMSPEVLNSKKNNFTVDFYSLGITLYELLFGKIPYKGLPKKEIKEKILSENFQIKGNEIPIGYSYELADLINRLIKRKPNKRIGYNGISEIKKHPFFKDIIWEKYKEKKEISPFLKLVNYYKNSGIKKLENNKEDNIDNQTLERYKMIKNNFNIYNEYFNNFTWSKYDNKNIVQIKYINNYKNNINNYSYLQSTKSTNTLKKNNSFNNISCFIKKSKNNNNNLKLKKLNLYLLNDNSNKNINSNIVNNQSNKMINNKENNIILYKNEKTRTKSYYNFNSNFLNFNKTINNPSSTNKKKSMNLFFNKNFYSNNNFNNHNNFKNLLKLKKSESSISILINNNNNKSKKLILKNNILSPNILNKNKLQNNFSLKKITFLTPSNHLSNKKLNSDNLFSIN